MVFEKWYLQRVAEVALQQIYASVGVSVVWSWGIHGQGFGEVTNANGDVLPALILKVSGLLHTGLVIVALNEGEDLYEVQLRTSKGVPVGEWHTGVWCDELGGLIDLLVEKPNDMSDDDYRSLALADSDAKIKNEIA